MRPPWPTEPGACDSATELPIVSSTTATERTGIRLLLGGDRLTTVDFDSGQVATMPRVSLRANEFVIDIIASSRIYALTSQCRSARSRLLPNRRRRQRQRRPAIRAHRLGARRRRARLGHVVADEPEHRRLPHSARGWPPGADAGRFPPAGERQQRDRRIYQPDTEPTGPDLLLLVDATTGSERAYLGKGWPIAAGGGLVVWSKDCDAVSDKPCTVNRQSVTGGPAASYRLPRPAFTGVVSPDGRLIALTLERAGQDPRYEHDDPRYAQGSPIPPSDIALLHLDTGRLEIVPGIEVPAKTSPGLAFSADGRWLVIALDAGPQTRLLAWRAGLAHPFESTPITGPAVDPPPLLVLPPRADR
jgi:hypothetical protein